jgi:beta-lactamase regulating signal transducer with metallopeptidase domain
MNVVPVSAGAIQVPAPNNGTTAEALPPVFDNRENILPNQTLITADAPVAAGNGGEIIVIEKSGKPDYIKMLRVFWLCGTAVFSVWFIFTNLSFYRRIKRTRKPLDIRHPLPGYSTEALRSPCVFGFIRPAIYVTPPVAEDETTLKHVLAHETAHVKHGDNWWPLLWNLALALHWYNPLVWIASALRRLDSEIFADAGAVSAIGETGRLDYGETLIRLIISKTRPGDLISAATTMTGGKRGIAERIKMIVNKPRMAFCSLIAFLLIAAFSVSCTFTGAGANGAKKEEPPSTMPDYIQEFSEISEAFQKAEEAYAWFTGYGAIELDMSEKHFDNGIVWYGIVTREGISTISELKAYLSSQFDEATCEKLLSSSIGEQGDIPLFMERDGTLYCAAGVVGLLS